MKIKITSCQTLGFKTGTTWRSAEWETKRI